MSVPIPLGVRIYQNWGHTLDVYVTDLVDDISYRSVIPGGFANATITLHNDQSTPWSQVTQEFNRVQICDLRTREIVWEGRIDTARRNTASDTWELGCLGPMAYASDIQKPHFYVDSDAGSWIPAAGATGELFGVRPTPETDTLTYAPVPGSYGGPNHLPLVYTFDKPRSCAVYIGRFDITYSGSASTSALRTGMDVRDASGGTQTNADVVAWNASSRLTNRVGTEITATNADRLEACWDYTGSPTVVAGNCGVLTAPVVQVQRVDETGAKLQTSASYPQEYLTVEQIVRDAVGRFMVGAWRTAANNTPYPGQVGSEQIYIDTSGTAQITHLTYYDGTTAAQILTDLMEAQPNAYWALWETRYGSTASVNTDGRFRFEWATWPVNGGYTATSIDGFEGQPDGGGLANFIFWQHPDDVQAGCIRLEEYFNTVEENQLLRDANLVRAVTIKSDKPTSAVDAFIKAEAYFRANQRTINTGTLTVRRPIYFFDDGSTSNSGASRMVDPWAIRPGKLIRITDLPARGNGNTFASGSGSVWDNFDGRTEANGWGTAPSGQTWTATGGSAADFSVSGGFARHSMGTATNISRWTTIPAPGPDFDVAATVATDVTPAGGSHFIYVAGRWSDANNAYVARLEFTTASAVNLTIRKRVGGTETLLATAPATGLTHAANRRFFARFKASGSFLMAKIWLASSSEPVDWNVTATDTDLTEVGSVGHRSILASANTNPLPVLATFDNFTATATQPYAPELDGTVFRVVGTTYNSSVNSCLLELDQPPAWNTATQVLESGSGSSNLVVRG